MPETSHIANPSLKVSRSAIDQTGFRSPQLQGGLQLLMSILFVILSGVAAYFYFGQSEATFFVILAATAGGYMALNIGANDVANNVSPAYGSGAITLFGAIIIAVIFETAGALLAGGSVVSTISKGIIDASQMPEPRIFMYAMISALLAGATWLNLATWIGAPVSTTHSIVGAVLGAGIAAAGMGVVHWDVMTKIAASWVVSPLIGGVIAALFLHVIEKTIFSQTDMLKASKRWVPVLLGVMAGAFTMYLVMKGLKKIIHLDVMLVLLLGVTAFAVVNFATAPLISRASGSLENHRRGVNRLFTIPLIFSTALLSFSHGANDVANAIGPLSAVVSVAGSGQIAAKVNIPLWIMGIGAAGIALGLAFYGAKLIRKVGKKLTALDQSRAYCVCLSAAITVILATMLGLPVSSTHIAIGSIFGVGFYREIVANAQLKTSCSVGPHSQPIVESRRKARKLVRRRELLVIASAWVITVPSAALISALIFTFINQVAP